MIMFVYILVLIFVPLFIGVCYHLLHPKMMSVEAVALYKQPCRPTVSVPEFKYEQLMQCHQMESDDGKMIYVDIKNDFRIFACTGEGLEANDLAPKMFIGTTHDSLWDKEEYLNIVKKKTAIISLQPYAYSYECVSNFIVKSWMVARLSNDMDWDQLLEMLTTYASAIVAHPDYNQMYRQNVWYPGDNAVISAFIQQATTYIDTYLRCQHPNPHDFNLMIYTTLPTSERMNNSCYLHIVPACKVLSGDTVRTLVIK